MAKEFHEFLDRVEHGETVRIRKHGRAVARLVPDCEFITGRKAADVFRPHKADARDDRDLSRPAQDRDTPQAFNAVDRTR